MNHGTPPAGGFGATPVRLGVPPPPFGPVIPPSPHEPSTRYAKATLFVGILSLAGLALCFLGLPLAIGSIAMGFHSVKRCKKYPDLFAGRGYAIAGIVCGATSLVLTVLGVASFFIAV